MYCCKEGVDYQLEFDKFQKQFFSVIRIFFKNIEAEICKIQSHTEKHYSSKKDDFLNASIRSFVLNCGAWRKYKTIGTI